MLLLGTMIGTSGFGLCWLVPRLPTLSGAGRSFSASGDEVDSAIGGCRGAAGSRGEPNGVLGDIWAAAGWAGVSAVVIIGVRDGLFPGLGTLKSRRWPGLNPGTGSVGVDSPSPGSSVMVGVRVSLVVRGGMIGLIADVLALLDRVMLSTAVLGVSTSNA